MSLRISIMQEMEAQKVAGDQAEEPRDTYRIAYLIHFLLGAGNLLPWNALITAIDYFGHKYPSKNIEKVFAVAYMGSSMLVLVTMVCWGGWRHKLILRVRMNLGFSMFVLSVMVTPAIDWAQRSTTLEGQTDGVYAVTVGSVVICGLADGLIGGSLIGSAAKLPKEYMQAVFAGTASSGVLVSILRIITKASLPKIWRGLCISAHLYFLGSSVILLGCIVCCNLLFKLRVMKEYYRLVEDDKERPGSKFWEMVRKVRGAAFGVFLIYTVTLSIFPGFIADNLKSNLLHDWYPILLITLYNVADLIGKCLTAVYVLKSMEKAIWACIARLLFYPLFALCLHGPRCLSSEGPVILTTFTLGLTNGYLTSLFMILAPKSVAVSESEASAIVMAVFLGMGLVCGSVLGWFWII